MKRKHIKLIKNNTKLILGILGSVTLGAAAFVSAAYVRSGRRDKSSPLIPDKIEQQIDKLVAWLDDRFGKQWVDRGMDALQAALTGTGPGMLVRLLEPVFLAEINGQDKGWTGGEKMSYAASHLGPN